MHIDDRRIEEIRLLVLWLDDAGFVQAPRFIVLRCENQFPSVVAETEIALLAGRISNPLRIAVSIRCDVHSPTAPEGILFAFRTHEICGAPVIKVRLLPVGSFPRHCNPNLDLGRLGRSVWQNVDLAIVTKAKITVLRDRQKPDRILFQMSDLLRSSLLRAVHWKFPDIERPTFLGQIEE